MLVRSRQRQNPFDLITDVAEAPRLAPSTIDGNVLTPKCLLHEIGYHSSVIEFQSRTIGIKDSNDPRIHLSIAVISHVKRLSKSLGLIIDGTRANGIYMPPVTLFLWMDQRISITFRR